MRLTPRLRWRILDRDAGQASSAIDNLRVCLTKLAARASALGGDESARAVALAAASRHLGLALGEIDKASAEYMIEEARYIKEWESSRARR